MNLQFAGSPDPATAAAIIACIEAALADAAGPERVRVSAWRQAGIRENVTAPRRIAPGAGWRTAIAGP